VACLEVGVSRSAGQIWKNGTTVRRRDGTVKVVPPLEPLAVRPISPRFLSEEQRVRIADMASRGDGPTVIGRATVPCTCLVGVYQSATSAHRNDRVQRSDPHACGQGAGSIYCREGTVSWLTADVLCLPQLTSPQHGYAGSLDGRGDAM